MFFFRYMVTGVLKHSLCENHVFKKIYVVIMYELLPLLTPVRAA